VYGVVPNISICSYQLWMLFMLFAWAGTDGHMHLFVRAFHLQRNVTSIDWIWLPVPGVQWRSFVDTVKDLQVPWRTGNFFWLTEQLRTWMNVWWATSCVSWLNVAQSNVPKTVFVSVLREEQGPGVT
jgi:hypothetical protein